MPTHSSQPLKHASPFSADALAGRVVLVTGAAGTYGRAISYALASAGARVVMTDVDGEALDAARLAVRDAGFGVASLVVADMTRVEDVERLMRDIVTEHGRLDGLVHAAAYLGGVPFLEYEIDAMDRMIALNLRATLVCAQRSARVMAAHGGGSIVLLGSVGSLRAHASAVVYDACKGAVDAGARAMAVDLAPYGIRVNVIAPPRPVDRDAAVRDLWEGTLGLGADGILKRDLANAVVFLHSSASERMTGQVLVVDNGLTASLRWQAPHVVADT